MRAQGRPSVQGRTTVARHGQLPSRHPIVQVIGMVAVAVAVMIVSVTGVAAYSVWDAATALTQNAVVLDEDEVVPPSLGAIEGGVDLLVAGTDSCEGQDLKLFPRCAEDDGGERNDVTMLVHITDNPRRVTVVSFPRDMEVDIPACDQPDGTQSSELWSEKINVSYWQGGLACTVKTVEALTGESIEFAAAIRWTGVINMSDAIGGVDVCVAGEIDDRHTGLHLTEGPHTLQGAEALQFLRIRHGIGDGSDLGRISNQQQFMSSMVRKLQSQSVLANPGTLLNLATTALSQVSKGQLVLSSGLTNPALMVQIAMAVKDIPYDDIVFVQYPTYYASAPGGSRVLPVQDAATALFAALDANQAITLTGDASQGWGVEVTGEATEPAPSATPSATPTASGSPTPGATTPPAAEERVELPSAIAGTTAAQVTCTRPQY